MLCRWRRHIRRRPGWRRRRRRVTRRCRCSPGRDGLGDDAVRCSLAQIVMAVVVVTDVASMIVVDRWRSGTHERSGWP